MAPAACPRLYRDPDFLDPAACRRIRKAMDRGVVEPAEVFAPDVTLDVAARWASSIDVDAVTLEAVEAKLDAARDVIAAFCNLSLVAREGPGFLRYGPGGFYRRHRDREVDAAWPGASRRLISVIVFLNSSCAESTEGEFSGGDLVLFPAPPENLAGAEAIQVAPRQGTLVAFDSATVHEVRPVRGGVRDVIVDWYYGAKAQGTP